MNVEEIIARTNRLGEVCPSWCATDHDSIVLEATETRPALYAHGHTSDPMTYNGPFAPRVYIGGGGADTRVHASALSTTLDALPGRAAEELAKFVEQLASYSPDHLRQMAEEIRVAAGIIEAGPCGLCWLRSERGVQPPPGGCTCQAAAQDGNALKASA